MPPKKQREIVTSIRDALRPKYLLACIRFYQWSSGNQTVEAGFDAFCPAPNEAEMLAAALGHAEWSVRRRTQTIEHRLRIPAGYASALSNVLMHFARFLQQSDIDAEAAVSLQQEGEYLTLSVETLQGSAEAVRMCLRTYGEVLANGAVSGDERATELQLMELRQQLRLSQLALQNTKEMLEVERRWAGVLLDRYKAKDELVALGLSLADQVGAQSEALERKGDWLLGMLGSLVTEAATDEGRDAVAQLTEIARNDDGAGQVAPEVAQALFRRVLDQEPTIGSRILAGIGGSPRVVAERVFSTAGGKFLYDVLSGFSESPGP